MVIGSTFALALLNFYVSVRGPNYAPDFHYGLWPAAHDLLHGRSPFPPADPHRLLALGNAFVTPPLLAVLGVPFSLLPFGVAVGLWNAVCVLSFVGALWVLGVRRIGLYVLALASVPLIDSLDMGQPDAIFALAAAVAWRYRDSDRGAVALGALIAAKLLAAPLLIWLLMTRRTRSFAVASASAVGFLLSSWALIGFAGLSSYPKLLGADARAFEAAGYSFSLPGALIHLGITASSARWLAVVIALAIGVVTVRAARERDQGWFVAALMVGLLISPLMWLHYLTVLLVPAALRGQKLGIWVILSAILWLALALPAEFRFWEGTAAVIVVSIWSVAGPRVRRVGMPLPQDLELRLESG